MRQSLPPHLPSHAVQLAGSELLDQGPNLCPSTVQSQSLDHWIAREVPEIVYRVKTLTYSRELTERSEVYFSWNLQCKVPETQALAQLFGAGSHHLWTCVFLNSTDSPTALAEKISILPPSQTHQSRMADTFFPLHFFQPELGLSISFLGQLLWKLSLFPKHYTFLSSSWQDNYPS